MWSTKKARPKFTRAIFVKLSGVKRISHPFAMLLWRKTGTHFQSQEGQIKSCISINHRFPRCAFGFVLAYVQKTRGLWAVMHQLMLHVGQGLMWIEQISFLWNFGLKDTLDQTLGCWAQAGTTNLIEKDCFPLTNKACIIHKCMHYFSREWW